jgi:hypothetical protein
VGRSSSCESKIILLRLFHTAQRRRTIVLRSWPGEWNASYKLLDVPGRRRTGADVRPERSGARALEEEVIDVLGRVGAEGTVVDLEDAVAVKEAPRPHVAMAENPEEHSYLDGAKFSQLTSASGTEQRFS